MNGKQIVSELMRLKSFTKQAELANYLGVSYQTLSSWQRGRTSPNVEIILKSFPYINLNWLQTGEGAIMRTAEAQTDNEQGDDTMNRSNSDLIAAKFLEEIAEQRKLTQSVIRQNEYLIRMLGEKFALVANK